jgi:uncharacterized protein
MNTYLRTKPAWMQLIIFLGLFLGCFFVIVLVGSFVIGAIYHVNPQMIHALSESDFARPEWAGVIKGLLVLQVFIFVVPSLLFAYFADPDPLPYAGFKKPQYRSFILLGVLIIICSGFMVEWLAQINLQLVNKLAGKEVREWIEKGENDVNNTLQNILTMKTPAALIESILLVGVLPAIGEELFFRGILQRLFIRLFRSPAAGIVITGIIFSLLHDQFLGFLPRMILGIILGALYWYSGSLLPAIAGHFVFNSLQLVLVYFKVMDVKDTVPTTNSGTWIGLASLVVVFLLLNYMRKRSTTSYELVYHVPEEEKP